jgi:hypothetical protein
MRIHAFLTALLAATVAQASVYTIEYDFTGYAGSTSTGPIPEVGTPTAVPGFMIASDLTRGPGINPAYLSQGFSADNFNNTNNHSPLIEPTRANAILSGDYFQVGFTVNSSVPVSFVALDMIGRRSSATAPASSEWQYSLDGFSTDGVAIHQYLTSDWFVGTTGGHMPTIDLTGVAGLQDLADGTTVTFRLYAWDAGASGSTFAFGRSTQLSGEGGAYQGPALKVSVVPEPASIAFSLGLLALTLLMLRRRR